MLTALSRYTLTPEDTSSQNFFRQLYVGEKFHFMVTPSILASQSAQQSLLNFAETSLLQRAVLHTTPTSSLAVSFPMPLSERSLCKGFLSLCLFSSSHYPIYHVGTETTFNFFHMFTSANTDKATKANFGKWQIFLILLFKQDKRHKLWLSVWRYMDGMY